MNEGCVYVCRLVDTSNTTKKCLMIPQDTEVDKGIINTDVFDDRILRIDSGII